MIITDDPHADFDRWDDERQAELDKLPVCCVCDEPIQLQDDAVYMDGKWYCDECLDGMRKSIGDD